MMTSAMPQGQVTIERLCRLARVSRAGYYRFWQTSAPRQHDTAARDTIQRLVLANGRYRRGYRYITQQLRREGLIVNHKRVLRLMREDNLLGLRRRPFVPRTTDRRHPWPVVPNRARDMQLSGLDQLWVADITPAFAGGRLYIRLQEEFAYLAIILDAFSRRVVGWAMADHLGASLAVAALTMALAARRPLWGSLVPFRSRRAVRLCRVHPPARRPRDGRQHEPGRQSLRQCQGRALHPDAQERRDRRHPVPRSPRCGGPPRRLHRPGLQRQRLHSALDYQTPSRSRPSTARGPAPPRLSPRWVFKGCGNLR